MEPRAYAFMIITVIKLLSVAQFCRADFSLRAPARGCELAMNSIITPVTNRHRGGAHSTSEG